MSAPTAEPEIFALYRKLVPMLRLFSPSGTALPCHLPRQREVLGCGIPGVEAMGRRAGGSPPYAWYEVAYVNTIVPARALDERPYGVMR